MPPRQFSRTAFKFLYDFSGERFSDRDCFSDNATISLQAALYKARSSCND